jgi:hypothetical protein
MVDDSGVPPPLPRRVPGASGSPRPPARVELGVISEDLRQRVLTAIASELERDEAERRRNAQEQNRASDRGSSGGPAAGHAVAAGGAASGSAAVPANGSAVGPANISTAAGNITGASPANGSGTSPVHGPPVGWDAPRPGTPAPHWNTSQDEAADRGLGAAEDAEVTRQPEGMAEGGAVTDAGDAADRADAGDAAPEADAGDAADGAAPRPAVPLPRRAPGANGAPPPAAEMRREYLPSSLLGRSLDPDAHTEPLPSIPGTGLFPGGAAAAGSSQSGSSLFSPPSAAAAPPATHTPAGSPAGPAPAASGPSGTTPAGAPAESVSPGDPSAEAPPGTVSSDSVPPRPAPSAAALAAAPTMLAGSAELAAAATPTTPAGNAELASAPTMPAGSAELAAAAGFAPPAEPAQSGADLAPPPDLAAAPTAPADLAAAPTAPADLAAPASVTSPAPPPPMPAPHTSPRSHPPAASLRASSGYGWAADPSGTRPDSGRGAGPAMPLPAAKRPPRSGRPYRIAGVILAVVALVAAAVIALLLSGRTKPGYAVGQGPHARGAGAAVRQRAAVWVASQVSRTTMVACDPVMCQALSSHGVLASRLDQLDPQTISPLRSQIIVATARVRAQFGNVLSSVYAPAVLASFGAGPNRVEVRQTAPHGAAAYRAMLGADLANRKASGAQLLHSSRITATAIARHELAAGEVDGRLLIAIAQMAATHPMYIVDFGVPAPGADPDMPLRQADLAENAHAHHHAGHIVSAGYVRSMVLFLHSQHGPFRPARVQTVRLADGADVLRIVFTAPSPLGLLGPHA